jgi:hypothetical protein
LKKSFFILLGLLVLFNTGGYYFVYFQAQNYFKQIAFDRVNEYIPVENLTLFKINLRSTDSKIQKEIVRINDHEISYNGNMYDIYKEEINDDTLVLYCLSDENENILDRAFSEFVNRNNIDFINISLKSILKSVIKIALPPTELIYKNFSFFNSITFNPSNDLQNVIIDVSVPPPKAV